MGILALGGYWLSFHGSRSPRDLIVRPLELGFDGLATSPSEAPVDWRGLRPFLAELPAKIVSVRVASPLAPEGSPGLGLASRNAQDRARAREEILAAAGLARALRCHTIVLEPGRVRVSGEPAVADLTDRREGWNPERASALLARYRVQRDPALDATIRELHAILKAEPEIRMALTGSFDLFGLGEPAALEAILEDLDHPSLGYWHDAGVAAAREQLGLAPAGAWLDGLHKRLWGCTLSDSTGGEVLLPPGAGGVDYGLLASYIRRSRGGPPGVVEVQPSVEERDLKWAVAHLRKLGF